MAPREDKIELKVERQICKLRNAVVSISIVITKQPLDQNEKEALKSLKPTHSLSISLSLSLSVSLVPSGLIHQTSTRQQREGQHTRAKAKQQK